MSDQTSINANEITIQPETKKYLKEIAIWTMLISITFLILAFGVGILYLWPLVKVFLKIEFRLIFIIPLLPVLFYLLNVVSIIPLLKASLKLNKSLKEEDGNLLYISLKTLKKHIVFFSISIFLTVLYVAILFVIAVLINPIRV